MISIAMTSFNGEKYIEAQLKSFKTQTLLPDEVIICDDFSNDNTIEIVNRFKEDSPFKVLLSQNKEGLGIAKNFSKALDLCRGDYIFLSDQDDVWFPKKLESIINLSRKHKNKFVFYNNTEYCNSDLKPTGKFKIEQLEKYGLEFVQGCCAMVRKEILDLIVPIPSGIAHDSWIYEISKAFDIRFVHREPLQYYRIHQNNFSKFSFNKSLATGNISLIKRIKRVSINKITSDLAEDSRKVDFLIKRFNEKKSLLPEHLLLDNFKEDRLLEQKKANQDRIKNLKLSLVKKYFHVLFFFISGKYSDFYNGYRSFLKDFFLVH